MNRLQCTLLEEKEAVTDTRKRNTILTLVAWLKRVLQTSTTDNADAQMFSLTELLPTELLLTKLMPQLNNGNDIENNESARDDRSPSSKRFSRQKNNRFNTVGVSKEELADARLYLQKKLLSENLATTTTKVSNETEHQTIFDESDDSRRKSLNLTLSNDLDRDIRSIFRESKNSFSKSIDIVAMPEETSPMQVLPITGNDNKSVFPAKTTLRRKSNSSNIPSEQSKDEPTDSDEEDPKSASHRMSNTSTGNTTNKSMNKFALRKMKMKRANTIDIPKEQLDDLNSDQGFSDGNKNSFMHDTTVNDIRDNINANVNTDVDKNHLPEFQVKSSSDKKFLSFLNKNTDENHSSWVNPHKTTLPVQQKTKQNNWSNKFGSIKNSFEQHETVSPVSPKLTKKNNFTHAPTSPFKPVQSNKPPQVPNGVHHYQYNNNHNVQHKITALQSHDKSQPQANPNSKPQLRTYQSVPSYPNDDVPQLYRDPNVHVKANDWQQNKFGSVDSYMQQNTVSPKTPQNAYNPLYVPLNKQPNQSPSNPLYASPHSNLITPKSQVSTPNEFPNYTFTSTDYTQPSCVSTFGPESMKMTPPVPAVTTPPVVKNSSPLPKSTILPDTSYLKSTSPPRTMPKPLLGSSKLSKQMKTIDVYSSNEYLSEPNNYYRSPQPFSPTYDYNYAPSHTSLDSQRSSGEFMATSQIMKYPQSQTATVVNKINQRYDDEQQASNLRTFLTNNRKEKRHSEYSEQSISPVSEQIFSHVNQTYVPPVEPKRIPNNFVSMENISAPQFSTPEQGAPIRLRNNTSYYGSHNVLVPNDYPNSELNNTFAPQQPPQKKYEFMPQQSIQNKFDPQSLDKSKIAAPMKLNSYGSQYIQPKVESDLDFSKPTYGRKPVHGNITQNNVIRNNVTNFTNLNRSNTTIHQRVGNYEIKRKQSLPAQNADYFDSVLEHENEPSSHSNNYLPFGALKKSKSTHTLALLQQFETKGKTEEDPLPSYVRRPIYNQTESKPMAEIKPKPIIKKTPKLDDANHSLQHISRPIQPVQAQPPIQQTPKFLQQSMQQSAPIRPKSPPPPQKIRPKTPPKSATIRMKTPPQKLEPPEIKETPSSPLVEDGHIIYPGQTLETKRRVQHYAQTLNAMLNRKSIVVDDDDEDVAERTDVAKPLQRSKSGTLLSVPKQYESAIKKSEVLKKEQTVAAYFAGSKSPQGLQRSSSQHSMQSSTSMRTVEEQKSNTVSPLENKSSEMRETSSRTTTTTKSAHHMKILRKKQTSPNPLAKSQTLPNLLDENNVDDAFDNLFASFTVNK